MKDVHLSNGEWKLMNLLWEKSPLTIGEMVELCEDDTGWKKSTIFMMLKRMKEKGAVRVDTSGKRQLYYPCVQREQKAIKETKSFLERVYDGKIGMMVSSMAGQKALSKEDIDELYDILKELRDE